MRNERCLPKDFQSAKEPTVFRRYVVQFMGLNLSTAQIAKELSINKDDAYYMSDILRSGVVEKKPDPELEEEVECDEVYVVAGHKGKPDAVKKKAEKVGGID